MSHFTGPTVLETVKFHPGVKRLAFHFLDQREVNGHVDPKTRMLLLRYLNNGKTLTKLRVKRGAVDEVCDEYEHKYCSQAVAV